MPCVLLAETEEPDLYSVYPHTQDIVAMPQVTFTRYVALVAVLRQRVQALSSCFQSVKGIVDEV